jgi:NADH-quinone oxidoreductase subunit N
MYFDAVEDKSVFQAELDTRLVLSLNGVAVLALGIAPGWLIALCVSVIAQG